MADKNSKVDYELITKYLAGEASAEESYVVTLWLDSSPTNQQKFERLKLLWEQTGNIIPKKSADLDSVVKSRRLNPSAPGEGPAMGSSKKPELTTTPEVDVEQAWKKFQNRVNTQSVAAEGKPHFQAKSRNIYYYLSRAAAVIILGVSAYLLYESTKSKSILETRLATTNETTTDTLPDGSMVALNNFSELRFPEEFKTDERSVSLKGEAYFEVTSNPEKPFLVKVEGADIQVLGTEFTVRAYDSLDVIYVGVKEGSVSVSTADSEVILRTGESITIDKRTRRIDPVTAFNTNNLYWKSQTLIFQNEKLETVFETLENYYNIIISPENPSILDCRLTAKFYGEDIDQIFEIINTNFNLSSNRTNDQFIVSGHGCE